ncbi:MAG TPA: hypothetical protein VMZ52_08740 [Bryobacteraceae bacterium]|nr:hypothetical protein [Bryobacteraceae bacterium]
MTHPSEKDLALFAGRDLHPYARWRIARHLHNCPSCEDVLHSFESAKEKLRSEARRMPADLDWERLAAEMTGNIRVGLAAGECIAPVIAKSTSTRGIGWRASAVLASVTGLMMTAWWLSIPPRLPRRQVTVQETAGGIELKDNGAALILLHQRGGKTVLFGSSPGSLRARYVDSETGQVTINNVYSQ